MPAEKGSFGFIIIKTNYKTHSFNAHTHTTTRTTSSFTHSLAPYSLLALEHSHTTHKRRCFVKCNVYNILFILYSKSPMTSPTELPQLTLIDTAKNFSKVLAFDSIEERYVIE